MISPSPSRRSFITGALSLIAAPAIIRVAPIMPVRALPPAISSGPFTLAELEAISNAVFEHYMRKNLERAVFGDVGIAV